VKGPPEAVIDSAVLHALVEFLLRSALQRLPLLERGVTIARDWGQHLRPVGEEKSVADVEENDAPFCHVPILLKASVEAGKEELVSPGLNVETIDTADALAVSRP
jgi:hypothetical protein